MPGTLYIDQARSFTGPPIALSAAIKTKWGSEELDITRDGEKRYVVEVAATCRGENGMPPQSEIFKVTVAGGPDLTSVITPGMPIEFDGLRLGVSAPERTEKGIRGGRAWYQADGVHPFTGGNGNGRPVPAGAKAE